MSAYGDLMDKLDAEESVEAIAFGNWGWDWEDGEPGYGEPDPPPVPFDKRGIILSLEEARPLMQTWSFYGGYGSPECYAVYIWTNERVIWVTQYDGATMLSSAPRNPIACMPVMPGG